MHDVEIHCVHFGLVAFPTALYLQCYLVSFVRGRSTCVLRLSCRFHWQESGFRRCDLLKSKSPVTSTWLSKESALPGGMFVDFSVARGELPPPRYSCRRLLASPRAKRIQTFASNLSLKLSVLPLHADLPFKSPCRLQSCPAQETEPFWNSDVPWLHVISSIDQWIRKC